MMVEQQLNGGAFAPFTNADWRLIRAYLEENERLFGVKVQDLLTVNGKLCEPEQVYRKVSAQALAVLAAERDGGSRGRRRALPDGEGVEMNPRLMTWPRRRSRGLHVAGGKRKPRQPSGVPAMQEVHVRLPSGCAR
jgi:hypothetical protein